MESDHLFDHSPLYFVNQDPSMYFIEPLPVAVCPGPLAVPVVNVRPILDTKNLCVSLALTLLPLLLDTAVQDATEVLSIVTLYPPLHWYDVLEPP